MTESRTSSRMTLEQRLEAAVDQLTQRPAQYEGLSYNETVQVKQETDGTLLWMLLGSIPAMIGQQTPRFTRTRVADRLTSLIDMALAQEPERVERLAARREPVHAISLETGSRTPRCEALSGPTGLSADVSCTACLSLIDKTLTAPAHIDEPLQGGEPR